MVSKSRSVGSLPTSIASSTPKGEPVPPCEPISRPCMSIGIWSYPKHNKNIIRIKIKQFLMDVTYLQLVLLPFPPSKLYTYKLIHAERKQIRLGVIGRIKV